MRNRLFNTIEVSVRQWYAAISEQKMLSLSIDSLFCTQNVSQHLESQFSFLTLQIWQLCQLPNPSNYDAVCTSLMSSLELLQCNIRTSKSVLAGGPTTDVCYFLCVQLNAMQQISSRKHSFNVCSVNLYFTGLVLLDNSRHLQVLCFRKSCIHCY